MHLLCYDVLAKEMVGRDAIQFVWVLLATFERLEVLTWSLFSQFLKIQFVCVLC